MLTLMHTIVIEHYLRIIGEFYNVCGNFTWRVSDCKELVGLPVGITIQSSICVSRHIDVSG